MSPQVRRCAIYTRKSSDEGLDQAFNSLDAQREACAAFIASQSGQGWQLMPSVYDDGGVSGGTMDRPALQRLLADIAGGQIDVVVVYKIDRLTRSLADFARMVELFDKHAVSFVSVTQQFNTTSSMGRLTLNVLLSFAQFEREVTGERIRDKIAASKKKGMWMGGLPPLGYDRPPPGSRTLVVNQAEADTVRRIFAAYLELGSVHRLQRWLASEGIVSKVHTTRGGRVVGGKPLGRGALFHLLRNRIYRGMIAHRGEAHPGMHAPIVDAGLFDQVQAMLDGQARRRTARGRERQGAVLAGRIFDADGHPMSPTVAYGKSGKRYRYYVSAPLQQGLRQDAGLSRSTTRRVPAERLESRLRSIMTALCRTTTAEPLHPLARIDIHQTAIHLTVPADRIDPARLNMHDGVAVSRDLADPQALRIVVPARIHCKGGRSWIIDALASHARPDPTLIKALRTAHRLVTLDRNGWPHLDVAPVSPHHRRLVRLAFLAPELQRSILEGTQPPGLTLQHLIENVIPADWTEQAGAFGQTVHDR